MDEPPSRERKRPPARERVAARPGERVVSPSREAVAGSSAEAAVQLSRVRVVLSQPSHPGNIGAAARAMKTMGLTRLVLVRPERFPAPEARARAANALDVLEAATVCASLEEALAGTALQVGFSARPRVSAVPALDARAAAREAASVAAAHEIALVFGGETAGLSNGDLALCNRLARIPTDQGYSSLNLASAVQIAVYELRLAVGAQHAETLPELAPHEDVERFFEHLERSLVASGFLDPRAPRRLRERIRRLFGRVRLEREEVSILRGMLASWDSPRGRRGGRSD